MRLRATACSYNSRRGAPVILAASLAAWAAGSSSANACSTTSASPGGGTVPTSRMQTNSPLDNASPSASKRRRCLGGWSRNAWSVPDTAPTDGRRRPSSRSPPVHRAAGCGASRKTTATSERSSRANAARRAALFAGRKPSNRNRFAAIGEAASAAVIALGPGMGVAAMPRRQASRTSSKPGSEMRGVPASETKATSQPTNRWPSSRSLARASLWSCKVRSCAGGRADMRQQSARASGIFAGDDAHRLEDVDGAQGDVRQVADGRCYDVQASRRRTAARRSACSQAAIRHVRTAPKSIAKPL